MYAESINSCAANFSRSFSGSIPCAAIIERRSSKSMHLCTNSLWKYAASLYPLNDNRTMGAVPCGWRFARN